MQKTTGGHHKPALPTRNSQSSNTVHSWLKKKNCEWKGSRHFGLVYFTLWYVTSQSMDVSFLSLFTQTSPNWSMALTSYFFSVHKSLHAVFHTQFLFLRAVLGKKSTVVKFKPLSFMKNVRYCWMLERGKSVISTWQRRSMAIQILVWHEGTR